MGRGWDGVAVLYVISIVVYSQSLGLRPVFDFMFVFVLVDSHGSFIALKGTGYTCFVFMLLPAKRRSGAYNVLP